MNMIKISIIIPVYNGAEYLNSCYDCVRKQSLKEKEIIFIDDGSTDNTLSILNTLRNYENVIILSQENAGAGAARNYGISNAKGEYVAFLDVDDVYATEDALEILYNSAKENDAVICGGSLISCKDKKSLSDKYLFEKNGFMDFKDYQFDFGFTRYIYRRSFLIDKNIHFPEYRIYEDPVFILKVMAEIQSFYTVTNPVYIYNESHHEDLTADKTVDYLRGLRDNLILSAECSYGKLHKLLFNRLETNASYYAEKNLNSVDSSLFEAMIAANNSINKELLKSEGIDIPDNYLIPALHTVWRASSRYMRLRKKLSIWVKFIKR